MKFISITKSINIRPDWASIGAVLKAGTPLDITGAVANSSAAVGILADDAEKGSAEVAVVTEGSIDLAEITASYGELTDDCIAAIKGVAFIGSDGNPIVPSGGSGAIILTRGNGGAVTGATAAEVRAAWSAGTPIFIKWGDEMHPATNYGYDEAFNGTVIQASWVQLKIDPETEEQYASAQWWRVPVNTSSLGTISATFVDLASAE